MSNLDDVKANLAFTCVYEKDHLPKLNPEADQLYRYARYVQKNNLLKDDVSVYPELERYFRIATAYDHFKANLELRQMIGKGQAWTSDPVKETLDLTEVLIKQGVPGGYYDMARYIDSGYGVKKDPELALRYYRKSADMGSPDGQYYVAEKLAPLDRAPEVARQMRRCAAEQGHGEAADSLARDLKGDKLYPQALEAFQLGVKGGNEASVSTMAEAFLDPQKDDPIHFMNVAKDLERSTRYKIIGDTLSRYSYLHPTVSELDEIVPLPPAKLPPWDGKIQWLKDHEANIAPPKPSEELIEKLAKAKGLDPKTGRSLGSQD
ncbi:sel1 repeat family protein [Chromobacterium amazonense]|uniref:SEL1-like repeat protein n=1 Tax=Chromobacterium amazonense TaxID=1382803 RepID=UPI00237E5D7C|nr:sel1 repeat family protein [Chromobacterium amazonense]MDE1715809.1 sel1 repeat family protein [Chromobacterium amazonense]